MAENVTAHGPRSAVPWWIDPYSDNPIAFGLLFLLIVIGMIGGMLLFRFLFIHVSGAQPITPPYTVWGGPLGMLGWR